jgi:hypothetical protein
MLLNQRKSLMDRRKPYKRFAKIKCYPGSLPRDCLITDVTERGLKLVAEDEDIPADFTIIFSTGQSRRCHLRWRKGYELGAEFIDHVRRRRRRLRRRRPLANGPKTTQVDASTFTPSA